MKKLSAEFADYEYNACVALDARDLPIPAGAAGRIAVRGYAPVFGPPDADLQHIWSVYGKLPQGGVRCIADCDSERHAALIHRALQAFDRDERFALELPEWGPIGTLSINECVLANDPVDSDCAQAETGVPGNARGWRLRASDVQEHHHVFIAESASLADMELIVAALRQGQTEKENPLAWLDPVIGLLTDAPNAWC